MKEYRVSVRDENGEMIARVRYNSVLDYWNGKQWENGGEGRHKGITKLKDGRYVIICGTEWQGEKDKAYIVTDQEALNEILKSGNSQLLNTKKFKELKKLYNEQNSNQNSMIDEE